MFASCRRGQRCSTACNLVDIMTQESNYVFFFFQAEDGIRDLIVTGVQTCALPISELILNSPCEDGLNVYLDGGHCKLDEAVAEAQGVVAHQSCKIGGLNCIIGILRGLIDIVS